MPIMNKRPINYYEDVMKSGFWRLIFHALVIVQVVAWRAIGIIIGQPIVFTKDAGGGFQVPDGAPITLPGGLYWLFDEGGMKWVDIFFVSLTLLSAAIVTLSTLAYRRYAEMVAFGIVDAEKIRKMGQRVRLVYSMAIFSFVLTALSFIFDVGLTANVWVGSKAPHLSDWLRFASDYYPAIMVAGIAISTAMAVWWARSVEFPRDVKFRV
jgi:hypothetical protein